MVLFVKSNSLNLVDNNIYFFTDTNGVVFSYLIGQNLERTGHFFSSALHDSSEFQLRGRTDFEFALRFYWLEIAHAYTILRHVRG